MPRLSELLNSAAVDAQPLHDTHLNPDTEVTSVDYDSRSCAPGSLFVAIRGFHADGHGFVADAEDRGAVTVVVEHPPERVSARVPVLLVPDSRRALSALAAAFEGHPSRDLLVAGITGTDGKTTTATMLWSAWRAAGITAGSLTTIDWRVGDTIVKNQGRQTTVEAVELQRHLRQLRDEGCTHVALETSSHGLALHRVDDVDFRCAVYTRITSEHLDLHGTREAYLHAKARLLQRVGARPDGVAVLDADDEFAFGTLAAIPVATRLTYSVGGAAADVSARDIRSTRDGLAFQVTTPWGDSDVALRLSGRFNVANALAALTAACSTGTSLADAVAGVGSLAAVTGRMERLDLGQPFAVIVDYAHTTEALEVVLKELRGTTAGRLWVVFGSAGERDVEKRSSMGGVAARLADVSVITDEDPRAEDRFVILEQIAAGATAAGGQRGETVVVIPDRADAIAFAVQRAAPGDTVLLAGKGHEGSIITGRVAAPWDERAVATAALRERLSR